MVCRRILSHWHPLLRARPRAQRRIPQPLPSSFRVKSTESSPASRIDRITARLPRRLQKYTIGLRNAPLSYVVSFLILHELTAVVPLLGLFALFHYTDKVPTSYLTRHFGDYVNAGIARFEPYFARKGWFGFGQDEQAATPKLAEADKKAHADEVMERSQGGEQKYKLLVDVALAFAVTKMLLPVRLGFSVWATPWFAGLLGRLRRAAGLKS